MAYGDIGGPITELVMTCRTKASGAVSIRRGDAVSLSGPYTVDNAAAEGGAVLGQALADCDRNGAPLAVRLRGVCDFPYTGAAPVPDGVTGVAASAAAGRVRTPASGTGRGIVLHTDTASEKVHVLI